MQKREPPAGGRRVARKNGKGWDGRGGSGKGGPGVSPGGATLRAAGRVGGPGSGWFGPTGPRMAPGPRGNGRRYRGPGCCPNGNDLTQIACQRAGAGRAVGRKCWWQGGIRSRGFI